MFSFNPPAPARIRTFITEQQHLPHSYPEVGHTRSEEHVPGYDNDLNFIELGKGDAVWEAAKQAIRQWRMFPAPWTFITPSDAPIQPGTTVAMSARVWGIWWLNSCRIVYTMDEPGRFGFAYGTLPGHVERGEEIFMVERTADDTVRYVIKAFSKPRLWLARLAYPVARAHQKKFVRDSKAAMLQFVQQQVK
ncbi:MAG TPA: DUF1990 domain-containing protein [Saprospiraceae bacterium]|nr:DUF1990 domain-containing protein [Saprospiraceae bacterium]HPI05326.1 DUF1990 domain-containing protein [Saprospiraceae bacterium]